MSSTATEKWEQTALEQLVRSPGRGGHAPGEDWEGGGRVGRKGGASAPGCADHHPKLEMPLPDVLKGKGKQVCGHAKEGERESEPKATSPSIGNKEWFSPLLSV